MSGRYVSHFTSERTEVRCTESQRSRCRASAWASSSTNDKDAVDLAILLQSCKLLDCRIETVGNISIRLSFKLHRLAEDDIQPFGQRPGGCRDRFPGAPSHDDSVLLPSSAVVVMVRKCFISPGSLHDRSPSMPMRDSPPPQQRDGTAASTA